MTNQKKDMKERLKYHIPGENIPSPEPPGQPMISLIFFDVTYSKAQILEQFHRWTWNIVMATFYVCHSKGMIHHYNIYRTISLFKPCFHKCYNYGIRKQTKTGLLCFPYIHKVKSQWLASCTRVIYHSE